MKMRKIIAIPVSGLALVNAAFAETNPFKPADNAQWYAIVGRSPYPSQPLIQLGPFLDREACENAISVTIDRNAVAVGFCIPDRSDPNSKLRSQE